MVTLQLVSDTLTPELERMHRALVDPGPVMRTIANVLDRGVKRNFRAEGRPTKWPRLAASTSGRKVTKGGKRRGSAHILRDTGRLIGSIQSRSGTFFAEIGTALVYAPAHQFGTVRAGRSHNVKIPRRPFIGSSTQNPSEFRLVAEDERDAIRAIDAHILGRSFIRLGG